MRPTIGAVALLVLLAACGNQGGSAGESPGTESSPTDAVPPGMRLVGLGHAAVAVPAAWGTNVTRCGVPQRDTVVIDVGAVPACGAARPEGVESVELTQGGPPFDFEPDEDLTIDGVRARRQHTTASPGSFGGPRVWTSTEYLPSMRVVIRAQSSTGAAEVDEILARVRVVPELVGVPGWQRSVLARQERSGQRYAELLADAGLEARVQQRAVGRVPAGFVVGVDPPPGTMVEPASTVTVTVSGD